MRSEDAKRSARPVKFRSQGDVWRNGQGNGRRGRKMQGQGSQELSDPAEGAQGRPGRAEGLLVRMPLSQTVI